MEIYESLKTARAKFSSVVPEEVFERFKLADRSDNYKYIHKMCELYIDGYNELNIVHLMKEFDMCSAYMKGIDITNMDYFGIVDAIEEAKKRREESVSYHKKRLKKTNLIYEEGEYRAYFITSFEEMVFHSKSTPWCIGLDRDQYDIYNDIYDIYVTYRINDEIGVDKNCILILKKDYSAQIVDNNNIHHFPFDVDYRKIIEDKFNQDIINLFGL